MAFVPYFDLRTQYETLRADILDALDGVCRNATFVLGPDVAQFEREFAAYCGVKHCVALNSGTSALHLALLAAGVGNGDEVVTTPNTFVATVEAVSYVGARPIFVDIDPQTGNLDPSRLESAISTRTRAIIPVHLYGRPVDVDGVMAVSQRHGIPVIEDACQAHGARWRGRQVGGIGLAGVFSFYPGKNLGAYGEAGALTTDDHWIAERVRALRDHGQTQRHRHDLVGYNYRMDGFQGAVLRLKLRHLDSWNQRRREIARRYRDSLGDAVALPTDRPEAESAYHLFVVWLRNRDRVRALMEAAGVQTAIHYPVPVHLQAAYASLGYGRGSFPYAERACAEALSLPLFPEMTDTQTALVSEALLGAVRTS